MWKYEKPKQKEIPPSSLIVQRVRKRVKGRADSFSNDDIYKLP